MMYLYHEMGLPWCLSGKESACQGRRCKRHRFDPWVGKIPQRRKWHPTPVFLPEKFHGQKSPSGYSPWGHKESDMTATEDNTMKQYTGIKKEQIFKKFKKEKKEQIVAYKDFCTVLLNE